MSQASDRIDVLLAASRGTVVERRYGLANLPRLREAGAMEGTAAEVSFHFLEKEGYPTVTGRVTGSIVLACQRCFEPANFTVDEPFEVACVKSESALDEVSATRDAVLADPTRVDLDWLAEEQLLLALPLVPKHDLAQASTGKSMSCAVELSVPEPEGGEAGSQQPFANLRDLLRSS